MIIGSSTIYRFGIQKACISDFHKIIAKRVEERDHNFRFSFCLEIACNLLQSQWKWELSLQLPSHLQES